VDPAQVGQPFMGRAALLSPFDRLSHDRRRMIQIFEFDHQPETSKPVANRRWGYFAQPMLWPTAGGQARWRRRPQGGVPWVHAMHEDAPFTRTMTADIGGETKDRSRRPTGSVPRVVSVSLGSLEWVHVRGWDEGE
jgi:uncharacterized protein YcaQ